MSMNITELARSRKFDGTTAERRYYLSRTSTEDEDDARDTLLSTAPATWEAGGTTLYRRDEECSVEEIDDGGKWIGTAMYVPQDELTGSGGDSDSSFEFDIAGSGTQHLMVSYSTTSAWPAGTAGTDDNGGLIGVTKDGVEGVDVQVGGLTFAITKSFDVSEIDSDYIEGLRDLAFTVNESEFSGTSDDGIDFAFGIGEVMLIGARGGVRNGRVVITFLFSAESNLVDFAVGDIDIDVKDAHDYLWVKYVDTPNDDLHVMTKKPVAAYCEQVYLLGDFTLLELT